MSVLPVELTKGFPSKILQSLLARGQNPLFYRLHSCRGARWILLWIGRCYQQRWFILVQSLNFPPSFSGYRCTSGQSESGSKRACVCERGSGSGSGRGGVRSRGGEGEGEGARPCAAASGEPERAAGSPRVSRPRGVAGRGQKVFSAWRGSAAAGGGSAMLGWEGTGLPSRERFKAVSARRWRRPRR